MEIMRRYMALRVVKARPMTCGNYYKYHIGASCDDSLHGLPGYDIRDDDGCKGWTPKHYFDRRFIELQEITDDMIDRLIESLERTESNEEPRVTRVRITLSNGYIVDEYATASEEIDAIMRAKKRIREHMEFLFHVAEYGIGGRVNERHVTSYGDSDETSRSV